MADAETMAFAIDYHTPGAKNDALRSKPLEQVHGGRLGVVGARQVTIGVTDLGAAKRRWQALLSPAVADSATRWALPSGPAIRLVRHEEDAVLGLRLAATAPNAGRILSTLRQGRDPLDGLSVTFEQR